MNGVENSGTLQRNSRIGGTVAIPVSRHQSLKLSYNRGAYIRLAGTTRLSVAWQYSWVAGRTRTRNCVSDNK